MCVVVRPVVSSRVTFAGNSTWGQPSRVRQTEGGLGEKRNRRRGQGFSSLFFPFLLKENSTATVTFAANLQGRR